MRLEKFKDISNIEEYQPIEFIAKLIYIGQIGEYKEKSVLYVFDGYERTRFIVYKDIKDIEKYLTTNSVYIFKGEARGQYRRYFLLQGFEEISITADIESKYYPERFRKPTPIMIMTYNTSLSKIADTGLRNLVAYCLGIPCDKYGPSDKQKYRYNQFAEAPASLKYHDSYPGGYIAHVADMLYIADRIQDSYSGGLRPENIDNIDWDLIRTIIYLHDIGKPLTYKKTLDGNYKWNESCLENHELLGSQYVYSCWAETHLTDEQTIQKICYCIAEHMNNKYDVAVPELSVLRAIDNLDTSIVSML